MLWYDMLDRDWIIETRDVTRVQPFSLTTAGCSSMFCIRKLIRLIVKWTKSYAIDFDGSIKALCFWDGPLLELVYNEICERFCTLRPNVIELVGMSCQRYIYSLVLMGTPTNFIEWARVSGYCWLAGMHTMELNITCAINAVDHQCLPLVSYMPTNAFRFAETLYKRSALRIWYLANRKSFWKRPLMIAVLASHLLHRFVQWRTVLDAVWQLLMPSSSCFS